MPLRGSAATGAAPESAKIRKFTTDIAGGRGGKGTGTVGKVFGGRRVVVVTGTVCVVVVPVMTIVVAIVDLGCLQAVQ